MDAAKTAGVHAGLRPASSAMGSSMIIEARAGQTDGKPVDRFCGGELS
jgi:hypothetical protein